MQIFYFYFLFYLNDLSLLLYFQLILICEVILIVKIAYCQTNVKTGYRKHYIFLVVEFHNVLCDVIMFTVAL